MMEPLHMLSRERPQQQEMLEKSRLRETLFSVRSVTERPNSVHTEFMESDWELEDDGAFSDLDDEDRSGEDSPRVSLNSSGQPSMTTMSSYDEVQTPRSSRPAHGFTFDLNRKPVEGPKGPHLFRSSLSTTSSAEFQSVLSLSPVTPIVTVPSDYSLPITVNLTPLPLKKHRGDPFRFTDEALDTVSLSSWSPEMIAQWMLDAGVDHSSAERFIENDINGAILITLKFEDLKELGIASFGVRTRIWEEIYALRNARRPSSPVPDTPIDDEPDREVRRERKKHNGSEEKPKRRPRKPRVKINDVISPLESVSIVGIEQILPKPHNCGKGENCSRNRRIQRMKEAFEKEHPCFEIEGGTIMVAGNPGNPETAEAIQLAEDETFRPVSDAIPSVVASSDVMGPGDLPPLQYLEEATLRSLQSRDPQDNVRQFLDFQQRQPVGSSEVPPTPPFEILPRENAQAPHRALRGLPKLSIPVQVPPMPRRHPASAHPIPSFREMSDSSDEDEETTPTALYRFGTPFSEMDVPVTAVPLGPVAREVSQSVPPDMAYRHAPNPIARSASRATSRRPSFPVLPVLDENAIVSPVSQQQQQKSFSQRVAQRPLQAPPRGQYPWTQTGRPGLERAIAPIPGSASTSTSTITPTAGVVRIDSNDTGSELLSPTGTVLGPKSKLAEPKVMEVVSNDAGVSYQGPMRKRKTKMLRHEWHEHFFTLRGTRLAMHKDAAAAAQHKTLEYVDIDDYAIACSSLASNSKLNAAFKAMHIRRGSGDGHSKDADVAAFSFQLIPQDQKGGVRLRKRESGMPGALAGNAGAGGSSTANGGGTPAPGGAANGTGKAHHFAVKSRDERIDWMRELMLAKALKQKGEGVEVIVNGSMI